MDGYPSFESELILCFQSKSSVSKYHLNFGRAFLLKSMHLISWGIYTCGWKGKIIILSKYYLNTTNQIDGERVSRHDKVSWPLPRRPKSLSNLPTSQTDSTVNWVYSICLWTFFSFGYWQIEWSLKAEKETKSECCQEQDKQKAGKHTWSCC